MSSPSILWFRHDLRLADNPALAAAVAREGAVVPVFVWSPDEEGRWPMGAASRWWLHQSLAALGGELERLGAPLIIRRGAATEVLPALARETGAGAVLWNRRYEPDAQEVERRLATALAAADVRGEGFNASLLFEPDSIRTQAGEPFRVFTPFSRVCLARELAAAEAPRPNVLRGVASRPASLELRALGLEPRIDWAGGMRATWTPGEAGAQVRLKQFLDEGVLAYGERRDRPALDGVSGMSPHLHFGEIGPRQIWRAVLSAVGSNRAARTTVVEGYLRQVLWREFAYHLLVHFPQTSDEPLRGEFADFPWDDGSPYLRAWQRGQTGYPLVDAGMRQLWQTGWMHNRVRMVVASFLVKDLLVSWRTGARWFWDTLVDADLANNTLGWQWTAGCGADAAPYFRIFNPVSQGEKFDPTGEYVRRYVPELARLDAEWIHRPFAAPAAVLRASGLELGRDYPLPVVDHAEARTRALAALATISRSATSRARH